MGLISYGAVTKSFTYMAQMAKFLRKQKNGELVETRLDCYSDIPRNLVNVIITKFEKEKLPAPDEMELFVPTMIYPNHVDGGGMSYFIALEEGIFTIGGVNYIITPFVLYAFEDSKEHNSNFGSIMIK